MKKEKRHSKMKTLCNSKKIKKTETQASFCLYGRDDRIRTCNICRNTKGFKVSDNFLTTCSCIERAKIGGKPMENRCKNRAKNGR